MNGGTQTGLRELADHAEVSLAADQCVSRVFALTLTVN